MPSTNSSAPSPAAVCNAAALTSTAMTLAPIAFAIITTDRPTPPQPCTATHCPASTRPWVTTARNAVANRQPRDAAAAKEIESGRRTRLVAARGSARRSANEPGRVNPGCSWSGQTCASPAWQNSHRPQPSTNGAVTRSPTRHPDTSPPTSMTVPANSWPGIRGSVTGSWPRHECQSDLHTPVAATSSTTPSGGQRGSASSTTEGSAPVSR